MPDDLENVAYRAWWEFYEQLNQRLTIPRSRQGQLWTNRHRNTFIAIAEKCLERGINVTHYIQTCFQLIDKDTRYLTPADFKTDQMFFKYQWLLKSQGGSMVIHDWKQQVIELTELECTLIPKVYASNVDILMDVRQPFTPTFRVLYLDPVHMPLLEQYATRTWEELSKSDELRAFMRKQRPTGLEKLQEHMHMRFSDFTEIVKCK